MNLETLMVEIKKQKRYAEEDIYGGNPATLQSRKSRKQLAKGRLDELFLEYKRAFRPSAAFILVTGSESRAFANVVTEETETCVLDGEGLYKKLASKLPKELLNGRESTASLLGTISRQLEPIAAEIDVLSFGAIMYKSEFQRTVRTQSDALDLIKRVINSQVGSEMAAMFALNDAAKNAVDAEFTGNLFPVMVYLEDSGIANEILSGISKMGSRGVVLQAGTLAEGLKLEGVIASVETVDRDSVMLALKKVKSVFTKSKTSSKTKGE